MLTGVIMPLLSLWIILLCGAGAGAGARRLGDDDESWSEGVSRGRCASRCLRLHDVPSTPQNNGSLGWCQHHKQCSKCLEPCRDSWRMKSSSSCGERCERMFPRQQWECVSSCEFLQAAAAVKQGSCPPADGAAGFAAACVESCDRDGDCSAQKKCCSNNCGHTCQTPRDPYKGVPLKPRKELVFEELSSGELELRWSPRSNASEEPVVYILQRRWNFGIQPSEDTATSWQEVAWTTEQEVRLSDLRPGRWYQFRVAAVNSRGSRGFTTPSRHVHSSRDPPNPPAPTELRVANMSFGRGRVVSAIITWKPPADLDVPVHHYRVSWSWTAVGQTSPSRNKRRKTVTENQIQLDSMRSNRSYGVQVQAVSYWGQTQLKGPKVSLQFSTSRRTSSAPRNPASDSLDVGTPFYHDGQLRVHVYWQSSKDPSLEFYIVQWKPEYCGQNRTKRREKAATRENFVSLQGLLFSCKYKVLWQPVSKKTRLPAESVSFLTPSCATIQAKSPKPITCPRDAAASPQILPMKAANLTASFRLHGSSNVSAVFSWDLSATRRRHELIGYQATWMEIVPTRKLKKKLQHGLISQSQVLPPSGEVLEVSGLHPASVYRLEVRAITAEGEGPATSRTFQTPGYLTTPRQRLELRKHRGNKPIPEKY
ncbi:anosmin-1a [Cololabis saira]|uniref:anosmin-1a n=1 Tax=Cololabis saira TaxID=129043 RepID=UPI002AD46C99|nr:anosmin-1a [Cololabis saira]